MGWYPLVSAEIVPTAGIQCCNYPLQLTYDPSSGGSAGATVLRNHYTSYTLYLLIPLYCRYSNIFSSLKLQGKALWHRRHGSSPVLLSTYTLWNSFSLSPATLLSLSLFSSRLTVIGLQDNSGVADQLLEAFGRRDSVSPRTWAVPSSSACISLSVREGLSHRNSSG